MKHLSDRQSNPFGLRPPFDRSDADALAAVPGYGDPNADFHVIGDHPGRHGGTASGVPFDTDDDESGVRTLLRTLGFLTGDRSAPELDNCFLSYVHMCTLPDDRPPTDEEYARLERFFDAELRAINAHILVSVGEQATAHVLEAYTTQRSRVDLEMETLHATELRGRGFLVVPLADPRRWDETLFDVARDRLASIHESDYRQTKGVATLVG
ncbi:uracil-DNA glycosylase [Halovivax ruber XH-70]|uniref:Uracil-DNA glycosylase n=1 Tax=Halovivax ruber (strain DSM 18193 / JCM 13892 / XH-70) TaxID=797302 RepID=L0IBA1_HALRX|nr:uracil-DNA glycosylase family protein [Halovivax ruber]AGB16034.1 uracil-DNA glycosylase [Halovivax ruber XH-70]